MVTNRRQRSCRTTMTSPLCRNQSCRSTLRNPSSLRKRWLRCRTYRCSLRNYSSSELCHKRPVCGGSGTRGQEAATSSPRLGSNGSLRVDGPFPWEWCNEGRERVVVVSRDR